MSTIERFMSAASAGFCLARGIVTVVDPDGLVRVRASGAQEPGDAAQEWVCEVLEQGGTGVSPLAPGEAVLIVLPPLGARGIVLGRIGRALPAPLAEPDASLSQEERPARLHLRASQELLLECGGATIRITGDGRVIIRGEHILTRAKGTQRIKGGSVAIN
jgi:hypothetical protein